MKYKNCTNFEGIKILVFKGQYVERIVMDPHFSDDEESPIARFKPTVEGINLATKLVESFDDESAEPYKWSRIKNY